MNQRAASIKLTRNAAIKSADVVNLGDRLSRFETAMQVSKDTRRIFWQNILFALGAKGLFLILGAFGIAPM